MVASACLTLAVIYWLVWYRNRTAWVHLLFSLTAASTTAWTFCELWMLRAETPGKLLAALGWAQVALFFWLVSITWFVKLYLGAGRPWLAWTICGIRAFYLLPFSWRESLNYREITSLRHIQFLGEPVAVLGGVPNPWMLVGQSALLMLLIFVADASVTAWRRGDRRKALMVGGSVEFFLLAGLGMSAAVLWGGIQAPFLFGLLYLGLVAVMGYELSHDLFRASQFVQRASGERSRAARKRGAHEPGRRCRRLWHLDPGPRAKRNLGEREVAGVVWLRAVRAAGLRRHPATAAPRRPRSAPAGSRGGGRGRRMEADSRWNTGVLPDGATRWIASLGRSRSTRPAGRS